MRRPGLLTGMALLLALAPAAWGTTVVYMSAEEILERAATTILGTVVEVRCGETDKGIIWTEVAIEVIECFHSEEVQKIGEEYQFTNGIFRFRQWGGQVGDRKLVIHGAATFTVGEKVLVSLQANDGGPRFCVGLAQGKYRIDGDHAVRDMNGLEFADAPEGSPLRGGKEQISSDDLFEFVREHYRKTSQRTPDGR